MGLRNAHRSASQLHCYRRTQDNSTSPWPLSLGRSRRRMAARVGHRAPSVAAISERPPSRPGSRRTPTHSQRRAIGGGGGEKLTTLRAWGCPSRAVCRRAALAPGAAGTLWPPPHPTSSRVLGFALPRVSGSATSSFVTLDFNLTVPRFRTRLLALKPLDGGSAGSPPVAGGARSAAPKSSILGYRGGSRRHRGVRRSGSGRRRRPAHH